MPISEKRTVVYRGLKPVGYAVQITLSLFAGYVFFKNGLGSGVKSAVSLENSDFVTIILAALGVTSGVKSEVSLENSDFVTIILAALGVMIAVFTVIISILAIWGYNNIEISAKDTAKETAEKTAKETAEKIVKEWLASEAPLLLSKRTIMLTDATLGLDNDETAADDIGKQAG
jgi:hypothetical protein